MKKIKLLRLANEYTFVGYFKIAIFCNIYYVTGDECSRFVFCNSQGQEFK